MALAYAKVLQAQKADFDAVGRSEEGAAAFEKETGVPAFAGGIARFTSADHYEAAIIAVDATELASAASSVISLGCRSVLLEKPGAFYRRDLEAMREYARKQSTAIVIAYNRRHLASTLKAKELIQEDGGVRSFSFEFNEKLTAKESIRKFDIPQEVVSNWFIGNSTHVVDLAFCLGGVPRALRCFSATGPLWDPHPSYFFGAGITERSVPFSYRANWELAGPWSVIIGTKKRTLVLQPLEVLFELKGEAQQRVALDGALDAEFKPGLYKQVEAFLAGTSDLPGLDEHLLHFSWYEVMLKGNHV